VAAFAASTVGCSLITSWAGYAGDGDAGGGDAGGDDAQTDSGAQDDVLMNGDSNPEDAIADSSENADGRDATSSDAPIADGPAADAPAADTSASDDSGGDATTGDAAEDTGSAGNDAATDASAPIAFVQVTAATPSGNVTTASATFSQAQVAGDLIVLVVGWGGGAAPITQVGDSVGNGYASASAPMHIAAGISQSIYYAKGIAAAPAGSNTVTVTVGAAVNPLDLCAVEYAGLDPVAPLDTAAGFGGRGTSASSGLVTTATARELVFGAGITLGSFTGAGAAFSLRKLTGTTVNVGVVEDRIVSSTGMYSADAPLASNASYVMQVATFR
jgi:hypothetical protein